MWPLNLFLFLIAAAPAAQQKPLDAFQDFRHLKLPAMQHRQLDKETMRKLIIEKSQRNTCYTMRSYFFRRPDGQAPVPAGMITCTPARVLQQRRVSPAPAPESELMLVPLGAQEKDAQQKDAQQKEK